MEESDADEIFVTESVGYPYLPSLFENDVKIKSITAVIISKL